MSEQGVYLGIDPGYSSGSICLIYENGRIEFEDIKGDWSVTAQILLSIRDSLKDRIKFAVLEKVGAVPIQGRTSAFTFGSGFGALWFWLLYEGIPHAVAAPAEWQQHVRTRKPRGTTAKERTKDYVMMKYPKLFQQKFDHNRADALCLAEHARRLSP